MAEKNDFSKFLPLSETTFYTMTCLAEEPMHGYVLMQRVKETSQGTVHIGAGTLYTIFSNLEKENLIQMISEVNRRKSYALTPKGKQVLLQQIHRIQIMASNGRNVMVRLSE